MNQRDAFDLLDLIERFVDQNERTPALAAEIEGIVVECCQDEPWFEEVSESLALFVPGGDGHYINEHELARELASIGELLGQVTDKRQ